MTANRLLAGSWGNASAKPRISVACLCQDADDQRCRQSKRLEAAPRMPERPLVISVRPALQLYRFGCKAFRYARQASLADRRGCRLARHQRRQAGSVAYDRNWRTADAGDAGNRRMHDEHRSPAARCRSRLHILV